MIIKNVCNKDEKREKMKKRDTKNTNTWNWGERGGRTVREKKRLEEKWVKSISELCLGEQNIKEKGIENGTG